MSEHNAPSLAPSFEHSRVTLIHHAMVDFVMTHKPWAFGLYPLLNLIVLLVHRPVLLVVFKAPIRKGLRKDQQWVQSLRYPKELSDRLEQEITEHLKDEAAFDRWLVKVPPSPRRTQSAPPDCIHGLGLFYLHIERTDEGSTRGQAIDTERSRIAYLPEESLLLVRSLFASLQSYVDPDEDRSHMRHVARYWVETRSASALFARPPKDSTALVDDLTPEDLIAMLRPVLDEFEAIYRDLRGGTPGMFNSSVDPETGREQGLAFSTRKESGAPLLWSRHRESQREKTGIRPLTLAFFLQLRFPSPAATRRYRLVPVVPKAMALDEAAVLIDQLTTHKRPKAKVLAYLKQLGIRAPTEALLRDRDTLAEAIYQANAMETFLAGDALHSNTYPAFASGISTLVPAMPCSRCDRMAYGPDFLAEKNEIDTAFVKPTLVSGFPYMAFVTKTRAVIDNGAPLDFSTFYFNYLFQLGIIRRWISRRVRVAVEKTYLDEIGKAFREVFQEHVTLEVHPQPLARLHLDWLDHVNRRLRRLAMAFPYAMVRVKPKAALQASEYYSEEHFFTLFEAEYLFHFEPNRFYNRKLINDDERFIKVSRVRKRILEAREGMERAWALAIIRKLVN